MKKTANLLLLIGIIGTATFGFMFVADYAQELWGNKDIWWTPLSMALPLDKTTKQFEMFVKDETLQNHLQRGSLSFVDKRGQSHTVVSGDVKVRLNNWNKIKASILHRSVFMAFLAGSSVTFLILGMLLLLKKEGVCNHGAPTEADKQCR